MFNNLTVPTESAGYAASWHRQMQQHCRPSCPNKYCERCNVDDCVVSKVNQGRPGKAGWPQLTENNTIKASFVITYSDHLP